jgi:hypothetical protein
MYSPWLKEGVIIEIFGQFELVYTEQFTSSFHGQPALSLTSEILFSKLIGEFF